MNKKKFDKVLVVLGGTSGERAISLESGRACIKALKKKGYKVSTFDPKLKNFNRINKKKLMLFLMPYMEEMERMVLHKAILST